MQKPTTGEVIANDEQIPGCEYMYDKIEYFDDQGGESNNQGTQTKGGGDEAQHQNADISSLVVMGQLNTSVYMSNTSVDDSMTQYSQWMVVPDDENPLTNPAEIDIIHGHGYCFVNAYEGKDGDAAKFICWDDGDTNPFKLVDVTIPSSYNYTAIFLCVDNNPKDSLSEVIYDHQNMEALSMPTIHGGEPFQVSDEYLTNMIFNNTHAIFVDNKPIFTHVLNAGKFANLYASSEYNDLANIIINFNNQNPISPKVVVSYDELGNTYTEVTTTNMTLK